MNRDGRVDAKQYWTQAKIIQIWRGGILSDAGQIKYLTAKDLNGITDSERIYIGEISGTHYFAINQESIDALSLRDLVKNLNESDLEIAVTALALINWHETHQKCASCGADTEIAENGWVRKCVIDGKNHFPRTDPAIIVAVQDQNNRLCLGRQASWPENRYSNFAGFVEPGESLEAAVVREVEEETGLVVKDINYLFSQPWPFPNSVMLAFEAFTEHPEVAIPDGQEIVDLRWFTKAQLQDEVANGNLNLPPVTTVSRKMIERWLNG
ncbi:MAG: NAD(+) diphosphatase [Candidatus Nanopelagicaceae bacterium]